MSNYSLLYLCLHHQPLRLHYCLIVIGISNADVHHGRVNLLTLALCSLHYRLDYGFSSKWGSMIVSHCLQ